MVLSKRLKKIHGFFEEITKERNRWPAFTGIALRSARLIDEKNPTGFSPARKDGFKKLDYYERTQKKTPKGLFYYIL